MADKQQAERDGGDGAAVTTGALARRLGVSPTTLRSWDRRYGLGPAVRADGRHRRWSRHDVAMVEDMCRLTATGVPPAEAARIAKRRGRGPAEGPATGVPTPPAPPPAPVRGDRAGGGLPLGDVRQESRGLARAAVRLDAPEVQNRLNALVREHGLTVTWDEVMVPTLRAVGRKWASSGDRYVEVEHLLSWHISTTLRSVPLLVPARPAVDAAPVLLACVPDEQHTLPLEALHAALGGRGVPTRMLGAAVPVEALLASVRRVGPVAVVLWSQARSTASVPLAQHLTAMEWGVKGARRSPAVLTAGPGWAGRAVPGLVRCHGLEDAAATLGGLYGDLLEPPSTAAQAADH
ncbi:MerR family transcriptional regulator [Streptomyces spectabilis]|uniref:DNA-binding transcriptional MerR regulator n=1 Tax=Streptomyces spectabilis TaxID=68270 RepID=A0A5P2XLZ8_STRST|nr:MerR family transcriptional regulator [Streptomyces spectabilis]MBB5102541.1 DNA-binding transcriptional MerR regulator [Streptomyces spectabilis]MCI3907581.1 MerR family transcriptional regulator [Streptomyces spectabilis]QEV64269.1 MerR family transcriptional regulator [Streptomyces spectabilis]GGV31252.1 transcriptional regulator [Streptomyces spectabilis]